MRCFVILVLAAAACSPRVEVTLHPEEGDKSIIIVVEDSEGLRAFGQDLAADASETLTQTVVDESVVQILYLAASLDDHGLTAGAIQFKDDGIPLPAPSHQEVWSTSSGGVVDESIRFDFRVAHSRCGELDFFVGSIRQGTAIELAPGRSFNLEYPGPGLTSRFVTEGLERIPVEALTPENRTYVARSGPSSLWTYDPLDRQFSNSKIEPLPDGTYQLSEGARHIVDFHPSFCSLGPFEIWACKALGEAVLEFHGPDGVLERISLTAPCHDLSWVSETCVACVAGSSVREVCRGELDEPDKATQIADARGRLTPYRGLDGSLGFVDDIGQLYARHRSRDWILESRIDNFDSSSGALFFLGGVHHVSNGKLITTLRGRGPCRSIDDPSTAELPRRLLPWGSAFAIDGGSRVLVPQSSASP